MQKKIELGQDILTWLLKQKGVQALLEAIKQYNEAVAYLLEKIEPQHSKRPLANSMEGYHKDLETPAIGRVRDLWIRLSAMLEMAREIYLKAAPLSKDKHLYSVTQAIRDAQAHIRPPDEGLPMLTMLPWRQMQTLGIASPFLSEHFENIHPEHSLTLHKSWGPLGMKQIMEEMKEEAISGKHKRSRFLYVVLTEPKGGDLTDPAYQEVYELVFTYNNKDQAIGHMDLAGGRPIAAGGELECYNGTIKMVDNSSGHFIPNGPGPKQAAINAFKEAHLGDISTVYIEKIWTGKAWEDKAKVEEQQAARAEKKRRQQKEKEKKK